jgi:hypothetical protein
LANLRELARGETCLVRVPGVCNCDPATTVLAHVRIIGVSGMSMKSPDWFGAWSCSACHEYVDGKGGDPYLRRLMLMEGMLRTQHELMKRGVSP